MSDINAIINGDGGTVTNTQLMQMAALIDADARAFLDRDKLRWLLLPRNALALEIVLEQLTPAERTEWEKRVSELTEPTTN